MVSSAHKSDNWRQLSRKFAGERGICKEKDERIEGEGTLKAICDRRIGESCLLERILVRKERLYAYLWSARIGRLRRC